MIINLLSDQGSLRYAMFSISKNCLKSATPADYVVSIYLWVKRIASGLIKASLSSPYACIICRIT